MLRHPIEPMPGASETLAALAASHTLILITKGDLFDQERKLAASGLREHFAAVEIVSEQECRDLRAGVFAPRRRRRPMR